MQRSKLLMLTGALLVTARLLAAGPAAVPAEEAAPDSAAAEVAVGARAVPDIAAVHSTVGGSSRWTQTQVNRIIPRTTKGNTHRPGLGSGLDTIENNVSPHAAGFPVIHVRRSIRPCWNCRDGPGMLSVGAMFVGIGRSERVRPCQTFHLQPTTR